MLEIFWNSVTLFFKGKLFQDPRQVLLRAGLGSGLAAVTLVVLVKIGMSLWLAVILAGLLGGTLQPRLFRDLKYR